MPYIKESDRAKFQPLIEGALGVLNDANDNPYLKGEFFGYFVNRLVRRFLGTSDYTNAAFNSTFFNESKRKTLENSADSIAVLLNRSDPMSGAGELNYAVSAVYWGFMGSASGFNSVGYGMRAYLNGVVDKVKDRLDTNQTHTIGNQKDATMTFRRHIVICGVLDHIKHETYHTQTVPYEEAKRSENGDVWVDGKLKG